MKRSLCAAWLVGSILALSGCAAGPNGPPESPGRPGFATGTPDRVPLGAPVPSSADASAGPFEDAAADALAEGLARQMSAAVAARPGASPARYVPFVQARLKSFYRSRKGQNVEIRQREEIAVLTSADGSSLLLDAEGGNSVETLKGADATTMTRFRGGALVLRNVTRESVGLPAGTTGTELEGEVFDQLTGALRSRAFVNRITRANGREVSEHMREVDAAGALILRKHTEQFADGSKLMQLWNREDRLAGRDHSVLRQDGTRLRTMDNYLNGQQQVVVHRSDGSIVSLRRTSPLPDGRQQIEAFEPPEVLRSRTLVEWFRDEHGASRIETVSTAEGVVRNTYDTDGALFRSEQLSTGDALGLGGKR